MSPIPSSIEAYLQEAGFSSTELLVLRNLIDEEYTLRQLAAKTGKSTGVLDQAIKKLLQRGIVSKEWINDTHKFRLVSLQAIATWVEEDTRKKQQILLKRHQNFEAFIQSLESGQKRPEMHYFEGVQGMERAYEELLEHGKELLHYFPVVCSVEDDPMRDFRVQLFRKRRAAGVFARYIVPDTPLGRRFATRDPFEYRKTLLVPEDQFTMSFEKVVADDIVACFNHADKVVCFICYKELAGTERKVFEQAWKGDLSSASPAPAMASAPLPESPKVPLSTRALSGLREFFLSRKSLALFAAFALVAAGVTYGLYRQNYSLNVQRLRDKALAVVATGATQFDVRDLDQLHVQADYLKPEYAKVVNKLIELRSFDDDIAYAWIMRPAKNAGVGYWEFIADADSIDPFAQIDLNQDGIVNEQDELQSPGQLYEEFDPYFEQEMLASFSPPQLYSDQWGTYITGSAPIRDADGKAVAIVGIDVMVERISLITLQSFNYIFLFVGLFLLFILIRLAAFNKSLFMEIWHAFKVKKVLLSLALAAEFAFFLTLGLYYYTLNIMKDEMGQKLMAIASTAASQFDPEDLTQIHFPRDMVTDAYQRVFNKLNEVRNSDSTIQWAYIFRTTDTDRLLEFVVDADTNYNIPYWIDSNGDGVAQQYEYVAPPGTFFIDMADKSILTNLTMPVADEEFVTDNWGTWLSGFAPIYKANEVVGIIGLDINVTDIYQATVNRFTPWLWFLGLFAVFVFVRLFFMKVR